MLVLVSLCLIGCNKKDDDCSLESCPAWDAFSSQASLNSSTQWEAQRCWAAELNSGKSIIQLAYYNQFGELREKIRIRDFDLRLDTIPLTAAWGIWTSDFYEPTAHFNTYAADGDAATEYYDLYNKEGFKNYLKINRISADTSEIEGEYQLFFVISPNSPSKFDESRPDTLIFTNGTFAARSIR